MNSRKCEYIHLSYRKPVVGNLELKLGNTLLKKVNQYKYLGTVIDEKLNGEAQYNHVTKVLAFRKQTFSKICFLLNQTMAISLYKTTIQPIFVYNDFFYNMLNQEKQDKLQTMQNRFLRIVLNQGNLTTEEMYRIVGTGKLRKRRELHLCGLMYKCSKQTVFVDDRDLPE